MMNKERRRRLGVTIALGTVVTAFCIVALLFAYGKLKVATVEREKETVSESRLRVLVAVDPIAYFVERVGDDLVDVAVLTPPGKDPETFAPTPKNLAAFSSTRVFFRVGLPIEERFGDKIRAIAPEATVVELAQDIDPLFEDADRTELDPHVWTSPANARIMLTKIVEALSIALPEKTETFKANGAKLDSELQTLQDEVKFALAPYAKRSFIVFHPAYGYYAREFELEQLAIESEGKVPRPRDLSALIDQAKSFEARALIAQPEFNPASVQAVATAIDGRVCVHSPLTKDYFENIRELTNAILTSFGEPDRFPADDGSR